MTVDYRINVNAFNSCTHFSNERFIYDIRQIHDSDGSVTYPAHRKLFNSESRAFESALKK